MWSEIGVVPLTQLDASNRRFLWTRTSHVANKRDENREFVVRNCTRPLLLFRSVKLKSADQTEESRRCEADQTQQPNLHELSDCSCRFNPSDGKSGFKWFNLFATECSPRRSGGQIKCCRASCSVNSTTNSSISSQWRGYRRPLEFDARRTTVVCKICPGYWTIGQSAVCRSNFILISKYITRATESVIARYSASV